MAKTNFQDPGSTEVRSTHISGLQEAVNKIEESLGMESVAETDVELTELYIAEDDRYRIFQAPAGKRNWLASPAPVIKKNGVTISTGFTIDYGGGAVIFNPALISTDTVTASFTRTKNTSGFNMHLAENASVSTLGHVKIGSGISIDADGVISSGIPYAVDSGASDDYVVTYDPAIASWETGKIYSFKANTANTGACTLNANALGAKAIKRQGTTDLIAGDISAGQIVLVQYDGTNLQILSNIGFIAPPGSLTFTSSTIWTVPTGVYSVDVFVVGGGGGSGSQSGGGGGYTKTYKRSDDGYKDGDEIAVTPGEQIAITIGAGGIPGSSSIGGTGGYSEFKNSNYRANGGIGGGYIDTQTGGAGGSGGGGWGSSSGGAGGSDGSNGSIGIGTYKVAGGVGQGHTTKAFGEATGALYAGGGGGSSGGAGGAGGGGNAGANGTANTGGGAGAGNMSGGSGVVIVRWGY